MTRLTDIDLPMGGNPLPNLLTAGQPGPGDFEALAAAGLKRVVNLRPENEDPGYDEPALAARLGLHYQVIPVAGPGDLTPDSARALDAALQAAGSDPVLIHCASSNRVGALLALRASWLHGASDEQALALGRAGGLTKMEPMVAQLLQDKPA